MNLLILIFCILTIFVLLFLKRHHLQSRKLVLLRVLFPSWRFFDQVGRVPKVFYRSRSGANEFGPWAPVFSERKRSWSSFILNPDENLSFAYHSLVEQLIADMNEDEGHEGFENTVSYKLVERMVRHLIGKTHHHEILQFKVMVASPSTGEPPEDIFISLEHLVLS